MNNLKRFAALVVFVAVAAATRMIVRYGVEGAINAVTKLVQGDSNSKAAKPKSGTVASRKAVPIVTPAPQGKSGAQLLPSAPLGAGPINAARNAAGAANNQLAAQTGQDVPAQKGATQAPAGAAPANQAPTKASAPVMQQGAPKNAATAAATPSPAPAPATATTAKAGASSAAGKNTASPSAPPPGLPVAESKSAALAPNAAASARNAAAAADTAPAVVQRETFDYSADSRRDPFISLMTTSALRPTLTDLRLTGILYDLSGRRPVAILRDFAGGQWRVTTGMTLGRMRVSQIKPKTIIFTIEEFGFNRRDSLVLGDSTRARY